MSTISKERLEQLASGNAWVCVQDDEAAELARIALASLEAEAVCYLTWHQRFRAPDDCEEYVVEANPGDKSCDGSPAFPVYAAPPAPVSVNITRDQIRDIFMRNGFTIKDGQTDLKDYVYAAADELVSLLKTQAPVSVPDAMEMDDDFDSAFEHGKAVGWNAYRAAMLQGADRPQNEPQNIPENIPATQFKPVADLYGLTSPTGGETSFTFDAVEARDSIDGGWLCQEYVELERFQEAITNHTEDKLAMVDHSGDSNNMVESVTTACELRDVVDAIRNSGIAIDGEKILAERDALNSPVIPDGWVACSDRMPDKGQNVLISVNFDSPLIEPLICSARYTGSTFRRGDVTVKPGEGVEEVTHWMPLPAAPQQEVK